MFGKSRADRALDGLETYLRKNPINHGWRRDGDGIRISERDTHGSGRLRFHYTLAVRGRQWWAAYEHPNGLGAGVHQIGPASIPYFNLIIAAGALGRTVVRQNPAQDIVDAIGAEIKKLAGSSEEVRPPIGATKSTCWKLLGAPEFDAYIDLAIVNDHGSIYAKLSDGLGHPLTSPEVVSEASEAPDVVARRLVGYAIELLGRLVADIRAADGDQRAQPLEARIAHLATKRDSRSQAGGEREKGADVPGPLTEQPESEPPRHRAPAKGSSAQAIAQMVGSTHSWPITRGSDAGTLFLGQYGLTAQLSRSTHALPWGDVAEIEQRSGLSVAVWRGRRGCLILGFASSEECEAFLQEATRHKS